MLLAQLLKAARQQSEYRTQEALAAAIGKERSTVGKSEQGERVPAWEVLQDILTASGVTGLARAAIEGLWWVAKSTEEDAPVKVWFSGYLTAEAGAHTIRVWQPLIFHGLFQTPDYTRALLAAADLGETEIQQQVQLGSSARPSCTGRTPRMSSPSSTSRYWRARWGHPRSWRRSARACLTCPPPWCSRWCRATSGPTRDLAGQSPWPPGRDARKSCSRKRWLRTW